ncbi:hypothetical protein VNO78_25343 [Psophocarpus tetragonolobus]|uniref:DUF4378 domain-containing protein n=1 Tax=Psophocarpus tetragonolobus TaxID=3891 RepID=A0AAN9XF84_PSOTE
MNTQVQQLRRFNSMERRPRMLKEFLSENLNSCSSSGFKSLPRKPNNNSMHSLIEMELKSTPSPFQTLMNTIRSISRFTSMKNPPSVLSLPRSLSRKLSSSTRRRRRRRGSQVCSDISIRTVKIKDIIRWKSFRDIVEPSLPPPPPPLDFMMGPTTWSSTSGSSWSESDFLTSSWEEAQNDNVEAGKRFSFSPLLVGKGSGTTDVLTCQEAQQSPVSVLQVGEDEFSPFDQSLANLQRKKQKFIQTVQKLESLAKFDLASLDQCLSLDDNSGYDEENEDDDDNNIEEQDWIEEKAKQLLHCVKARGSALDCRDHLELDALLLDFFREELSGSRKQYKNDEELEILRIAEDWINGSFTFDAGLVNKGAYIKDMDRRDQWSRFEDEQEELAFEIETAILHSLLADLLDLDG